MREIPGKAILVTGGAGYVGSAVVRALLRAGLSVRVFDSLRTGHRAALPAGCELVVGDLADASALDAAFEGVTAVMHFAALIEAGESMKVPEQFFRVNAGLTMNLLEAMLRHGVGRLVFSSTAALYGNPSRVPIVEDDRLEPTNAYGESKLMVERMLAWHHRIHGLSYASLRYFNAAGAGEAHSPETHLIPLVLQVPLGQRASVSIFGTDYDTPDGTCVRDYVHVDDLATAHVLALEALSTSGGRLIYNLGNGQGFSVREVIETARRVTGHAIPALESPRRPGDPAVLVASSDRIKTDLGWTPKYTTLESIVADAWHWHHAHPHGYR